MKKILVSFGLIFSAYFLFRAGLDGGQRYFSDMSLHLIFAAFWFAVSTYVLRDAVTDEFVEIANHRHEESAEQFAKDLLKRLDDAFDKQSGITLEGAPGVDISEIAPKFMECVKAVTGGGRAPTEEEQALIAAQFTDLTGWYARFIGEQQDEEGNVELSPVAPTTTALAKSLSQQRREAISQASTRKVQIPVVDGDKPVRRPRMTAKRKAAIAAEEEAAKREVRNAKRRAARAAKKLVKNN